MRVSKHCICICNPTNQLRSVERPSPLSWSQGCSSKSPRITTGLVLKVRDLQHKRRKRRQQQRTLVSGLLNLEHTIHCLIHHLVDIMAPTMAPTQVLKHNKELIVRRRTSTMELASGTNLKASDGVLNISENGRHEATRGIALPRVQGHTAIMR